ncbi:aminotransferase class V-fold PLP-dependent enzyme [Luteimonas suaedae]|uniref:aminotransferase class V-fold PLP-dependent enzyme n=1 Tax=Luteimonas suaedae TaxID=2605430 RepID=UPI0011EC8B5C|nr:aminotransferase class V-fold PLP-dependent enzyme [Luteimonas suaedae]
MQASRRRLLGAAGLAPLAATLPAALAGDAGADLAVPMPAGPAERLARDEAHWGRVARLYDVTRDVAQLDNGFFGSMARATMARYRDALQQVNHGNAYFARQDYPAIHRKLAASLAAALGVDADEIALTRGATEALQALIGGYNRLRPGDAVLHADSDYDSMITAMRWLHRRRGVDIVSIDLPVRPGRQQLLDAYAKALHDHPRVRMMLLTHVSHRNGLVLPVRELTEMARASDVDVIVDAAHSWGQLDFNLPELGADFAGINLHKWIGAPVGAGALYIRRPRIGDIDPYMGEPDPHGAIHARIHTGTANFAAYMALPTALELHQRIGPAHKEARVRYLRDRWVDQVRDLPGLEILTPDDPALHGAITSFRLRNQPGVEANKALARRLHDEFGVFTVHRTGLASGACVRATPAVFTSADEVDRLAKALRVLAAA